LRYSSLISWGEFRRIISNKRTCDDPDTTKTGPGQLSNPDEVVGVKRGKATAIACSVGRMSTTSCQCAHSGRVHQASRKCYNVSSRRLSFSSSDSDYSFQCGSLWETDDSSSISSVDSSGQIERPTRYRNNKGGTFTITVSGDGKWGPQVNRQVVQ
jgi:hypothetical protein